jgi:DNA-binding PadR family transcriptional regulator
VSAGQEILLQQLRSGGRIWRVRDRYTLHSPYLSAGIALTEPTVAAMVKAGLLREAETHGADRACYELTEQGRTASAR